MIPQQNFSESLPRMWLAPMEGVVDSLLRKTLTEFSGIEACVTEFLRITDQLLPNHVFYRHAPELRTQSKTPSGTPVYFQILGGQPEWMAENAARAADLGAIGIDINFGCPAKCVNRNDGGAVLLKTPERLFKITEAVRRAVPPNISVSAKMRLGFEETSLCFENASALESAGASWITVHARTKKQMYQPPVDWVLMGEVRKRARIPVIGNGDISTPDLARKCRDVSGCEHLMIGRGLLARPGLIEEIQEGAAPLPWEQIRHSVGEFYLSCVSTIGESFAAARLKQWLKFLGQFYPEARDAFEAIKTLKGEAEILPQLLQPLENQWQTAGLIDQNEE